MEMSALVLLGIFFVLLFLNVPISFCIGLATLGTMLLSMDVLPALTTLAQRMAGADLRLCKQQCRVVPAAIKDAGIDPADVIGIATDFTACTMVPTTVDGTPLSNLDEFKNNPHAYVKLWKHHAAQPHADRINELARERGAKDPYLQPP